MAAEPDARTLFLHTFIRELVSQIDVPPELRGQQQIAEPVKEEPVQQGMVPSPFQKVPIVQKEPIRKPVRDVRLRKPVAPKKQVMMQELHTSPRPTGNANVFPTPERGIPYARPGKGYPDLGRLNFLISDKRVEHIECPGPNKTVLVRKDGTLQRTSLTLTQDEIKQIIEGFSEQTRIPLIGGTFKAASGDVIMTAVLSDFVGSRFVLHKKPPVQQMA